MSEPDYHENDYQEPVDHVPVEKAKLPDDPADFVTTVALGLGIVFALATWFTMLGEDTLPQVLVAAFVLFGAVVIGAMRKDRRKAIITASMLAWPGFSVAVILIVLNLLMDVGAEWISRLFMITGAEMLLAPGLAYGVNTMVAPKESATKSDD